MKTRKKISLLFTFSLFSLSGFSQNDSLGLPGDNLDLEAVLSIFKNSSSVEDFEKKLNSASEKVNNLDLNADGQVDYLRVVEYGKDDFRSIVIQDPVSKTESHDVAVIEIEKKDGQTAHLQIVGDETLYGKNYIIEPQVSKKTSSEKNSDDAYADSDQKSSSQVVVNVWAWPAVGYIYSPGYSFWVSPWYWGYYPGWYSPWAPYGYYYYHRGWIGYNYGFYGYHTHVYAFPHVHHYYYGRRTYSPYVQKTAPRYRHRESIRNGSGNRMEPRRNPSGRRRDGDRSADPGSRVKTGERNDRIKTGERNDRIRTNERKDNQRMENKSQDRIQNNPRQNENKMDKRSPGSEKQRMDRGGNQPRQGGGGQPRQGGGQPRQGGGGGHRR
jgi:hypothetical protein